MQLRQYQQDAVNALINYFLTEDGNPIIAMPTATGKSLVIAEFCRRTLTDYPETKILMLTHVKELIAQNYQKLLAVYPDAPVGIFSASLKIKNVTEDIIFAGVDSVVRSMTAFPTINLIIVDECHMVNAVEKTRYTRIINYFLKKNKLLKVIGLTATPYRTGNGILTDGGLFDKVCFNLCAREQFTRLINDNFLAPLVPYAQRKEYDLTNVKSNSEDYIATELQRAVTQQGATEAIIEDAIPKISGRKKILVFSSGLNHTALICELLCRHTDDVVVTVDSTMTADTRDEHIRMFKDGRARFMVNYGILTTGFDAPEIDAILMLRPTKSTVLWVQMMGRGTRPAVDKKDCLVLDYGGNTQRLGTIDDPVLPRKKGTGTGQAPVRECPVCGRLVHISVRVCECLHEFTFKHNLTITASTDELISKPIVELFKVESMDISVHSSKSGNTCLRVRYFIEDEVRQSYSEYLPMELTGFARNRANSWWRRFCNEPLPMTCKEAHTMYLEGYVDMPTHIRVWVNKRPYPQVMDTIGRQTLTGVMMSTACLTPFVNNFEEDDVPF